MSFRLSLAGIALVGLAVRLLYAHLVGLPSGFGDDLWYHEAANLMADGEGFRDPFLDHPTAFHPPLFPALLALVSWLGATSYDAHQALGCALGAGTVAVIGLLGRRLGGERLGLIAAGAGALYLPLAINDSVLMSESLYGLLIALTLLAALRVREDPSVVRALLLGAAIAAAALTRSEVLLLAVVLVPLAAPRARLRTIAVTAAAVLVLTAPWMLRNTLTFDQPVYITTGDGAVLAGANQPSTYSGHFFGAWDFRGLSESAAGRTIVRNEAEQSERLRDQGLEYAGDRAGRVPVVMAVRVMRTFSIYPFAPAAKVDFAVDNYKHVRWVEWLALASLALVLAGAALGVREALRRGWPLALLVSPIALVVLVSAFAYGDPRFRQAAEIPLVLLAALALDAGLRRRSAKEPAP